MAGFVESACGHMFHFKSGRFCVREVGGKQDFAIKRVVDAGGDLVFVTLFVHLSAGVRVPAGSRGMHKVLISWSARLCTGGHISKYQLCLRNVYKVTAFVDYFRW